MDLAIDIWTYRNCTTNSRMQEVMGDSYSAVDRAKMVLSNSSVGVGVVVDVLFRLKSCECELISVVTVEFLFGIGIGNWYLL